MYFAFSLLFFYYFQALVTPLHYFVIHLLLRACATFLYSLLCSYDFVTFVSPYFCSSSFSVLQILIVSLPLPFIALLSLFSLFCEPLFFLFSSLQFCPSVIPLFPCAILREWCFLFNSRCLLLLLASGYPLTLILFFPFSSIQHFCYSSFLLPVRWSLHISLPFLTLHSAFFVLYRIFWGTAIPLSFCPPVLSFPKWSFYYSSLMLDHDILFTCSYLFILSFFAIVHGSNSVKETAKTTTKILAHN